MNKNSRVEIRVKEKDIDTCKFLHLSFSHIWDIGMEHVYKNMQTYVGKLYVQKDEIEANVRTMVYKADERNQKLDDMVVKYLSERDVENPSRQDLNWITAKIDKIDGLTVEGFLGYCKFKKEGR
jgi:hypothetical protein